jgi:hypothetical protein
VRESGEEERERVARRERESGEEECERVVRRSAREW